MPSMNDVLGIIMGGGRGSRLHPLTAMRSKPAVPIAGKYRLIDIPISNCIHSGMERMFVLTQFNSVSLHRHIVRTYKFDLFSRGFVQILAARVHSDDEVVWIPFGERIYIAAVTSSQVKENAVVVCQSIY